MNSSDTTLIKRVVDNYEELDRLEKGGIAYLKIALDEVFNISDVVITSIHQLFKNFAQDVVSKYPSGNVALLVQQINAVVERLAEVL